MIERLREALRKLRSFIKANTQKEALPFPSKAGGEKEEGASSGFINRSGPSIDGSGVLLPPLDPYFTRLANTKPVPFVICSETRTGSTMLVTALSTHSQIKCHGELMNPGSVRYRDYKSATEFLSNSLYRECSARAVGFKLHTTQARKPPIDDTRDYLRKIGARVILLRRRNLLQRYISMEIVGRSGIWGLEKGRESRPAERLTIDVLKMLKDFEDTQRAYLKNEEDFAGHEQLILYYEDLCGDFSGQLERIFQFLGVQTEPLQPKMVKQETRPLKEIITNFDEVALALRRFGQGDFLNEQILEVLPYDPGTALFR